MENEEWDSCPVCGGYMEEWESRVSPTQRAKVAGLEQERDVLRAALSALVEHGPYYYNRRDEPQCTYCEQEMSEGHTEGCLFRQAQSLLAGEGGEV